MSTRIMAKCWPLKLDGTPKSVLISLADQANDDGVCWPSVGSISQRTGWNERTVRRAIADLEKCGVLAREIHPGRAAQYRITPDSLPDLTESPTPRTESPGGRTQSPDHILNHQPTVNETSGVMSGKPDDAKAVLEFLNQKSGRNFRPTDVNLKLIKARLKEGYTPTECRQVVVRKCREWQHDDTMSKYLRPATLFNREKFNQYAGELVNAE